MEYEGASLALLTQAPLYSLIYTHTHLHPLTPMSAHGHMSSSYPPITFPITCSPRPNSCLSYTPPRPPTVPMVSAHSQPYLIAQTPFIVFFYEPKCSGESIGYHLWGYRDSFACQKCYRFPHISSNICSNS